MKRAPLLAALALAARAHADPVCARPDVIEYAAREFARDAAYETLIEDSVAERPTSNPHVVRCAADVLRADHDYLAYRVQTWLEYRTWTVRVLDRGYEVDIDP